MWVEGPERLPREQPWSSGRIYIGVAPAPHPHEMTLLGFSVPPPTCQDPGATLAQTVEQRGSAFQRPETAGLSTYWPDFLGLSFVTSHTYKVGLPHRLVTSASHTLRCLQVKWEVLANADSDLVELGGAPDSAVLTGFWLVVTMLPTEGGAEDKASVCPTVHPPNTTLILQPH